MNKQAIFLEKGQRFGLLVVDNPNRRFSLCKCDCGASSVVKNSHLVSGNTKSCGCRKRAVLGESRKTHGRSNGRLRGYKDRTYGIWQAMKDRCSNPNRRDWKNYGGRGIFVSDEWKHSFEAFIADMGNAPEGQTIDRINVNGPYSKENCRWISMAEQAANQRKSVKYKVGEVTKAVNAWAKEWGVVWATAKRRLESIGKLETII